MSPTSRRTALALQKVTQLIMYRAQVQRFPSFFFFSFCSPSKPKAFCKPQASTFTCFTPINAINKRSRAPCAGVLPPEPCWAAESRQGSDSIPQAGEESGFPRVRRGPGDSLAPPCYPVAEDHTNCGSSPV